MIDIRVPPLLYTLREYNKLKARQVAGLVYPSGAIVNGEWMTFATYLKGTQYRKFGIFDRTALVNDLLSQYANGGAQKNVVSDNAQITLLAEAERALFHRTLTPTRALAHACARYYGMGTDNASVFDTIQAKLTDLNS